MANIHKILEYYVCWIKKKKNTLFVLVLAGLTIGSVKSVDFLQDISVSPIFHTPDGTPGALVTVIVDAENGHVVVNIAVGSLERTEF